MNLIWFYSIKLFDVYRNNTNFGFFNKFIIFEFIIWSAECRTEVAGCRCNKLVECPRDIQAALRISSEISGQVIGESDWREYPEPRQPWYWNGIYIRCCHSLPANTNFLFNAHTSNDIDRKCYVEMIWTEHGNLSFW